MNHTAAKNLPPMDMLTVAKNIEVAMAIMATLIGVAFVAIDVFCSVPSILSEYADEPEPIASFLIAPLMITAVTSFLAAIASGETERGIVMPILRSLAFVPLALSA